MATNKRYNFKSIIKRFEKNKRQNKIVISKKQYGGSNPVPKKKKLPVPTPNTKKKKHPVPTHNTMKKKLQVPTHNTMKKKHPVPTPNTKKKKLPVPTPNTKKKKLPVPIPPTRSLSKKLPIPTPKKKKLPVPPKKKSKCNLKISRLSKPETQCITKSPFIIPAELGKRINDISILIFLLNSPVSINGLSKDTEFIYISSGTQGSVWKFTDLDGSLKIVKIPNLQKFKSLFKTPYGKLNIDDFKWVEYDIINLFNTFSESELTDFNSLNEIVSKIDMSQEKIHIKSTNTEIREGILLYNKKNINLNLVIKDYIDGVEPSSSDIPDIKNSLKDTSIRDIKKENIIKRGNYFYIIDFLL